MKPNQKNFDYFQTDLFDSQRELWLVLQLGVSGPGSNGHESEDWSLSTRCCFATCTSLFAFSLSTRDTVSVKQAPPTREIFWRRWSWFTIKLITSAIGRVDRVFAKGPGNQGSIPDLDIPNTLKTLLDASLLNPQHYKIRVKGKWSNPGKRVVPSPTHRCSSYWKGSLRVTLDCGRPTYIYIYIFSKLSYFLIGSDEVLLKIS